LRFFAPSLLFVPQFGVPSCGIRPFTIEPGSLASLGLLPFALKVPAPLLLGSLAFDSGAFRTFLFKHLRLRSCPLALGCSSMRSALYLPALHVRRWWRLARNGRSRLIRRA
jgi:hypothetical protein